MTETPRNGRAPRARFLNRLLAYSAGAFCGILLWIGVASPAGDWHRPVGLVAGTAGLLVVAVILLRSRL